MSEMDKAVFSDLPGKFLSLAAGSTAGEKLYNGIVLPEIWPPRARHFSLEPMPVPYLKNPPDVILIDLGRQLLVDNFLIEQTTLVRTFRQAQYHPSSLVLQPDQKWETGAIPFSGGLWHDPRDGLFKVWYQGVRKKAIAYATSGDGLHWEKPDLGVEPGTNIVHRCDHDTATVWLDLEEQDPKKRFKMTLTPYLRNATKLSPVCDYFSHLTASTGVIPGLAWPGAWIAPPYFSIPKVWVYSIKWNLYGIDITRSDGVLRPSEGVAGNPAGRVRGYREHPDLAKGLGWELARDPKTNSDHKFLNNFLSGPVVPQTGADFVDPLRNTGAASGRISNLNNQPELYNLDIVEMRVEILSLGGQPIAPFTRGNCLPLKVNLTLQVVRWQEAADVSKLAGKPVQFRFQGQPLFLLDQPRPIFRQPRLCGSRRS